MDSSAVAPGDTGRTYATTIDHDGAYRSTPGPIYVGGNFSNVTDCLYSLGTFLGRPSCGNGLWFTSEALLWWQRDARAPALVTTSPSGTPFGTAAVSGQCNHLDSFWRRPNRAKPGPSRGYALSPPPADLFPDSDNLGFEASGFLFGSHSVNFGAGSDGNGNPPIGVPFFGAVSGQEAANMVAFPGAFAGLVNVSLSSQLWGTEANFLAKMDAGPSNRLIFYTGFRYVDLQENLDVTQNTTVLSGGGILFNGTTKVSALDGVLIFDTFEGAASFTAARWACGQARISVIYPSMSMANLPWATCTRS